MFVVTIAEFPQAIPQANHLRCGSPRGRQGPNPQGSGTLCSVCALEQQPTGHEEYDEHHGVLPTVWGRIDDNWISVSNPPVSHISRI